MAKTDAGRDMEKSKTEKDADPGRNGSSAPGRNYTEWRLKVDVCIKIKMN